MNDALLVRVGGLHRQLQRVEHASGVAVGHVDQVVQRLLIYCYLELAVASFPVSQGPTGH